LALGGTYQLFGNLREALQRLERGTETGRDRGIHYQLHLPYRRLECPEDA